MRDARLIYAAAFLRSSSVGLIGVVLAIALTEAGVSVAGAGAVIGAGLVGIAAMTLVVTVAADRFGRRRTLIVVSLLIGFGYFAADPRFASVFAQYHEADRPGPFIVMRRKRD